MEEAVEEMIFGFVSSHFGVERSTLTPETTFLDDLDADSLDIVEMTIRVEEEYGILIEDEEALLLQTLADVVTLIEQKRQDTSKSS